MDKERNVLLKVEVVGFSREFLDEVQRALKDEPDMRVTLREEGVEALQSSGSVGPADVVIIRKTTRSATFYDILSAYIQSHPTTGVILTAPYKDPDMMVEALRAGVKEFLFEPFLSGEIPTVVRRLARRAHQDPEESRGQVVAILPCKGGAGATFLATNLAHILASRYEKHVLFLDLNLQFGDAYLYLMDHIPQNTLGEVCGGFMRFDYQFLESASVKLPSGLRLLAAPQRAEDGELVKSEHVEAIVSTARKHFDFVVLDVGRTLDTITLKALDLADSVFPVLQMSLPSIRDAQRMKAIFGSLNYSGSKVKWVINRYGGQGDLPVGDASGVIGRPYWLLPNDHKHVAESVNQGVPLSELHPHSPASKSLREFAQALQAAAEPSKPKKRWFSFGS